LSPHAISGDTSLRAGWSLSATDGWAVGQALHHWNGTDWTTTARPAGVSALTSVWGSGSSSVWAVSGDGQVIRWDGVDWKKIADAPAFGLFAAPFWTASGELWLNDQLAGSGSLGPNELYRWDGTRWRGYRLPGNFPPLIGALGGTSATDVWAFATDGLNAFHFEP
jgi:hypothetical protein